MFSPPFWFPRVVMPLFAGTTFRHDTYRHNLWRVDRSNEDHRTIGLFRRWRYRPGQRAFIVAQVPLSRGCTQHVGSLSLAAAGSSLGSVFQKVAMWMPTCFVGSRLPFRVTVSPSRERRFAISTATAFPFLLLLALCFYLLLFILYQFLFLSRHVTKQKNLLSAT